MTLDITQINFSEQSIVDSAGKVFFYRDKIYRAIYDIDYAENYQKVLNSEWIDEAFSAGLVRTKINDELALEGAELILEHEKIPFFLSPQEFTNDMFHTAVVQMIKLNQLFNRHGYLLKDSHSYNFTYFLGRPVFYDFASIEKSKTLNKNWIDQFVNYCAIPIALASSKRFYNFSLEYRREHFNGFGKRILKHKLIRKYLLGGLLKIYAPSKSTKDKLGIIMSWLEKNKPLESPTEYWSHYDQSHTSHDVLKPQTVKQKFVFDILSSNRPVKVIDLAANKGFYSEMASRLGASVIAFDYEEALVDLMSVYCHENELDITPALLNFIHPTPPSGWGLTVRDSFRRFNGDIVLALGLIHHICIRQRVPVELFCRICAAYSSRGVLLEFIDPKDKHVSTWKESIPPNYNLDSIKDFFRIKYPLFTLSQPMLDDGINRQFIYFHNQDDISK